MKNCLLLFLIVFLYSCISSDKKKNFQKSIFVSQDTVTLIFAGDVMNHLPQMNAAWIAETNLWDYSPCFQFIKPYIQEADISVCNLETVLAGKPYSGYPQFSAPDELLSALKDTGFDIIQLANNHVYDRGSRGMERTVRLIKKQGMYSLGAYINQAQRNKYYPPIFNVRGVKIAFLNYTYGTNGLQVAKPNLINHLDSIQIIKDIHYAKMQGADLVVALVHWGWEYELQSGDMQHYWADFFVKNKVDLIIGSHPHVVQNIDFLKNEGQEVPVYYSLGNFISNQRQMYRNGGILAKVQINTVTKQIITVSYIPFYVFLGYLDKKKLHYLIPTRDFVENRTNVFVIPKVDSIAIVNFHTDILNRLSNVPLAD